MKSPATYPKQNIMQLWKPLFAWFAPVLSLLAVIALSNIAVHVELSENLQPYGVIFFILTFLFAFLFLLITLPCAVYSGFLAVRTMVRERRYFIPSFQLLLDLALAGLWYMVFNGLFL